MKKGFSQSKNNIRVINLSTFPFLLVVSICFIFATMMLWHSSEPTGSDAVIPTFPAEDDPLLYEGNPLIHLGQAGGGLSMRRRLPISIIRTKPWISTIR
jgi:hypothetical protein